MIVDGVEMPPYVTEVCGRKNCDGCGAPMVWVKTKAGKNAPMVQQDGKWVNHFGNCPKADRFRKKK